MTRDQASAFVRENAPKMAIALRVLTDRTRPDHPLTVRPMSIAESEAKRADESVTEGVGPASPTLGGDGATNAAPPSSAATDTSTPPRPSDLTDSSYDEKLWESVEADDDVAR